MKQTKWKLNDESHNIAHSLLWFLSDIKTPENKQYGMVINKCHTL